jgi:hypothetical protein
MPAFTFEKISPPARRGSLPPTTTTKKQRGVIVKVLDRFVGVRAKRSATEDEGGIAREQTPSE